MNVQPLWYNYNMAECFSEKLRQCLTKQICQGATFTGQTRCLNTTLSTDLPLPELIKL